MELRIKELIKAKGYTQELFASKIGVSRMSLVKTLAGNPSVETLKKIADALGVEMYELFKSKEELTKEIQIEQENTITCPKCGAKFRMEEE